MELKGTYKLSYTLDKEPEELLLIIELKQVDGIPKKGQNVWEGKAMLNGHSYEEETLPWCVNAKLACERIGKKLRDEIKANAKAENKSFRLKNETIK